MSDAIKPHRLHFRHVYIVTTITSTSTPYFQPKLIPGPLILIYPCAVQLDELFFLWYSSLLQPIS